LELLIKNARIVDHAQDFIGDIYIKDGMINEVGRDISEKECRVFDALGIVVMPAFTDLHVHFREPGFTYKEDIESGSRAAARGGYTTVNLMANTNPPCSSMDIVNQVMERVGSVGIVDAFQCVSITSGMRGDEISHLDSISEPVKCVSDDGRGVASTGIMLKAMQKCKEKGLVIMSHAEDASISNDDYRLAENLMTWRDLQLCRESGAHLHMCHVSTKEAIDYIKQAKLEGLNVTCEVAPHHIYATDSVAYKVNPPLRKPEDVDSLIAAIKLGIVDAIATDHAPHTSEDKVAGAPGISGIETSFSLCYTSLVRKGHIDLCKLSDIMSKRPAEILGINKGRIGVGCEADLVVVDIEDCYEIDPQKFASKGKNTPFAGDMVYGKVLITLKAGRIVYDYKEE